MTAAILRRALLVMAAAAILVVFFRLPARLSLEIFHTIVEMPLSLAILFLAAGIFILAALIRVVRWLLAGALTRTARVRRAQTALARSQVAIAAGDHARALRESARALNLMPEHAGAGLILQAEAAELDGDQALARASYERLSESRETKFLGLRGLLRLSLKAQDRARALALARDAFALRPDSEWAADIVVALSANAGDSALARSTIDAALRAKAYDRPLAKRRRALIHYFESEAAGILGDKETARELAREALEHAPDHVGFACQAARWEGALGARERGAEILERCYTVRPNPALVSALALLYPQDVPSLRKSRIAGLVRRRADHLESRIALSEAALNAGDLAEARQSLGALHETPSFRSVLLRARLTRELGQGGDAAARFEAAKLYEAARRLPRDDLWQCTECREASPEWTALCPRCGALDAWSWPDPGRMTDVPAESAEPLFVSETARPPDDPGIEAAPARAHERSWRRLVPWLAAK